MNYLIYTLLHFTPHGRYELNKLTSLPVCGFIAQLAEHHTGIAEVTRWGKKRAKIGQKFVQTIFCKLSFGDKSS